MAGVASSAVEWSAHTPPWVASALPASLVAAGLTARALGKVFKIAGASTLLLAVATTIGVWRHAFEPDGRLAALDVLLLGAASALLPAMLATARTAGAEGALAAATAVAAVVATTHTSDLRAAAVLSALYGVAALAWLATRASAAAGTQTSPRAFTRLSRWTVPALLVAAAALGALLAGGGTPEARALLGFVPSSGGVERGATSARNGLGDGPDEVAGDRADSTGYDQSDRFGETAGDALYDLWVEAYGTPLTDPADRQKMVGLRPDAGRLVDATDREDLRRGRRFELRREPLRKPSQDTTPARAAALAYVEGRTPLHLRLAVFDWFDGTTWREPAGPARPAALRAGFEPGWFTLVDQPDCSAFGRRERWTIKLPSPHSAPLPVPPASRALKLGRVDRADFFREAPGGLLRTARDTLPAGTVVEVDAHAFALDQRSDDELVTSKAGRWTSEANTWLATDVRSLVDTWVAGVPPGWSQVDAVVDGLRQRIVLTPGATVSASDPLRAILVDRHPADGPHLASAATLILRSLGYPVRLAAGLYADPDAYDAATGQTVVTTGHQHWWPELRLRTGAWVPVEVHPGRRLIGPRPTWADGIRAHALAMVQWCDERRLLLTALATLAAMGWFARHRLRCVLALAWWRLALPFAADPVRHTLRALDAMVRAHEPANPCLARPPHQTPTAWLRRLASEVADPAALEAERFRRFAGVLEHQFYSGRAGPGAVEADLCRAAVTAMQELIRRSRNAPPTFSDCRVEHHTAQSKDRRHADLARSPVTTA
jgi:hypothetical protein